MLWSLKRLLMSAQTKECRVLILALFCATTLSPSKNAYAQQAPIRISSRLVQVHVVVKGPKDTLVPDLKPAEFILKDEGVPQEIAHFAVETFAPLGASRSERPTPPNVFSNRLGEGSSAPKTVTVILLDELNTRFSDKVFARAQVVQFLRQIQPGDRVALYLLRRDLRILHEFTSDSTLLLNSLDRQTKKPPSDLPPPEADEPTQQDVALQSWLSGSTESMSDFYTTDRVYRTVAAMGAIARHLARVPGRKNLVWISTSFPIRIGVIEEYRNPNRITPGGREYYQDVQKAARALNEANVAMYPVDARGLVAYSQPYTRYGNPFADYLNDARSTMIQLADRTGGRAFYDTNDIMSCIRKAAQDAQVTYVLGFYPTHERWNGAYRELKVSLKRSGVHARYRRGYYAASDPPFDVNQRKAALREAAFASLEAASIGLTTQITPINAAGEKTAVVNFNVDARDVFMENKSGAWRGSLDFFILQRSPKGEALAYWHHTVNLELENSVRQEMLSTGIELRKHLPLDKGANELRIVARDNTTGALGSVIVPLSRVVEGGPPPK